MAGYGGITADIPETMDRDRELIGVQLTHPGGLGHEEHQPTPCCLPSGDASAEGGWLSGHHRRDRVADVLRVGVHEPRHDLLVGPQVGGGDVCLRPDHVDDLHREPAGDPLQLGPGETHRVDPHPALGAPERDSHDGALPGHQHGQGRHLAQVDVRGIADAALGRAHGGEMLNPISEQGLHLGVGVPAEREADHGGLLRDAKPIGHVVVEAHEARHAIELTGGFVIHR